MSTSPRQRITFWSVLFGLALPAACGSSGVVGGECASGYIDCGGLCVDGRNDPVHCGGCALRCDPGVTCLNGVCDGSINGSAGTLGGGGESGSNGESGTGGYGAASGVDGMGAAAGDAGTGSLSDAGPGVDASCAPPYDRSTACGDCTTQCSTATPVCASDGLGDFHCVLGCEPPPFNRPEACGDCKTKCTAANPVCASDGQGGFQCAPFCDKSKTYDTPEACGDCRTQCKAPTPNCSRDGAGGYQCVLTCADPFKGCNGQCVDYHIDANNCGSCGVVCPSGICQGGTCVGAFVGHVVLACTDYQTPAKGTPQTELIGNAVLLPLRNPVRILAYTEYATATARANVDQALGFAATARGRDYTITPLSNYASASATLSIANYDVFLIYDQAAAPSGQLATVATAWQMSSVLDSFASAGGVIIGLSGGRSEMDQFFTNSRLLKVSAQTVVSGSTLYNRAPGDAIGVNVISPFLAPRDSCTFATSLTPDMNNIFVVSNARMGLGAPVVVHRVIAP